MTALLIATAVVPLVERDIALSLKFEFVSCSWAVFDGVVDDWRDNKWLAKRDEIRLMSASSSLVIDDEDNRVAEINGCSMTIFVGVSNSFSTGFDCGDVDDGRSELEPSPVAESAKLLTY